MMEISQDIKKVIRQVLPKRPTAINFKIDPVTDEYLWKQTTKYRIPIGTVAALILYWAAKKDLDITSIITELRGGMNANQD